MLFTHKPDTELIICCDYRVAGQQSGGQIRYEGAIDVQNVRDEFTSVTAGDPEAFRLRKDKYGF
jgi:type III restriction enzyme